MGLFKSKNDDNKQDSANRNGRTALHNAAYSGNLDDVNLQISLGEDVNQKDYDKFTPLHLAAAMGHLSVVKTLLDAGADIDALDRNGESPLIWAALQEKNEVFSYLVERGANLNQKSTDDLKMSKTRIITIIILLIIHPFLLCKGVAFIATFTGIALSIAITPKLSDKKRIYVMFLILLVSFIISLVVTDGFSK